MATNDCERRWRKEKKKGGGVVRQEMLRDYRVLFSSSKTNNVSVSVMLAELPSPKIMTWTHLSVKQNKSTASSGCSFCYRFLASRHVYKTAPYCVS